MTARYSTYQKVIDTLHELAGQRAAITIKAVAKRAGIARATLYNDERLVGMVKSFETNQHFERGFRAGERNMARADARMGTRNSVHRSWRGNHRYLTETETRATLQVLSS